jgi:tripartite-type tricarboxylate transporter receptor subunit TctC
MAGTMLLGKLDRSAFGMLLLGLATAVLAQDYPSKSVRMVVGFPPGGGTDVVARILAPRMSELLGQPVVIDNRHVSVNAIASALFSNLPYDVLKDFAPVAIAAAVPHLVTVHPSLQVNSLKELIRYLKAQPGKLTFPSAGNGSMPHLAGEIFKSLAGVQVMHVPYKGSGQSMQDLLGGRPTRRRSSRPSVPTAPCRARRKCQGNRAEDRLTASARSETLRLEPPCGSPRFHASRTRVRRTSAVRRVRPHKPRRRGRIAGWC